MQSVNLDRPGPKLVVGRIVSMPFEENTYVAHFSGANECVVIDPGLDPQAILDYLDEHSLSPAAILCTHGHSDHIAGNSALKDRWPDCPLAIGTGDAAKLGDPWQNLSGQFGFPIVSPPAERLLVGGNRFSAAGIELDVLDAPGHSIGHVVFVCRQTAPWRVFGGDVLFRGGIGRADFPDGNFEDLRRSIETQLFTLPDDTIVHAGHGSDTTIGHEKRTNPFVGGPAGYSPAT
jgi:glyoxylase-like metal-dependent hydrolase (beta-lactamase superfamily II)